MLRLVEIIGALVLIIAAFYGLYRGMVKLTTPTKKEPDKWTTQSPPDES
jgi:hypothetical protein